jgi:serine protease AprX
MRPCPFCHTPTPESELALAFDHRAWVGPDGACPACLQEQLLRLLLAEGDAALHRAVQATWPLDPEAAFGAIPTPLRLHADPRFTGRGVTLALIDAGFYPHADLVEGTNRIRAWTDQGQDPGTTLRWGQTDIPRWPGWDAALDHQWHGTMTSVVAAGNGALSRGLYRGLASHAELVLVAARDAQGRITNESVARSLDWVMRHREEFGIRVVNLSVSGDPVEPLAGNPVDTLIRRLTLAGVSVVAAAGNSGQRRLVPPATAPEALTVGGIDDGSLFDHTALTVWHSNYGESALGAWKPELVAPSIWVAAPVLPGTPVAAEAERLFARRREGDRSVDARLTELKAITPHYQHVDGTSFAAPVVASAIACLLQANPRLTPAGIREILLGTAQPVAAASRERQGAGVLDQGRAVARALGERHVGRPGGTGGPVIENGRVRFRVHDHQAHAVELFGSWDGWSSPVVSRSTEPGLWETEPMPLATGTYAYKLRLDGSQWIDDPANPVKQPDGLGGLNSLVEVVVGM